MTDEVPSRRERPLSPHLQVYKLPYNAKMSIIGRALGGKFAVITTLLLLWVTGVIWMPALYDPVIWFLKLPVISHALFLGVFAIVFYIGNGIRHVIWDTAKGVSVKWGEYTGYATIVIGLILTVLVWFLACDTTAEVITNVL